MCCLCFPCTELLHFLYPYYFWLCLIRTELLAFVKFLALEKELFWIVWEFYIFKEGDLGLLFLNTFFIIFWVDIYKINVYVFVKLELK